MKPLPALRILAVALLLGLATSFAQNTTVVRWKYGAPNAVTDTTHAAKVEGLKAGGVHIYVALFDIEDTNYNRAWVQVVNRGNTPIQFDPQTAFLKDGKMVRAEEPDKAASSIQRLGEARSQELSTTNCSAMVGGGGGVPHGGAAPASGAGCSPNEMQIQRSKAVLARSGTVSEWIRDKSLKPTTVAPGEQVVGAILFRKDKKPADYTLAIPVAGETFEFPVRAENNAPSYD
jgi:hypothetical protein